MAVLAGETIIAGKVPGERIATTTRTADSSAIGTTETVVDTVVAATVTGRTYRVRWYSTVNASVAGNDVQANIREDSVSGTVIQSHLGDIAITNRGPQITLECEYTADATEDKTFVATIDQVAGSGTVTSVASATRPTYLYVDYIRG